MYRTHTCGELNIQNISQQVTLAGWVQGIRKLGGMTFVDLRDRYGITQLAFNTDVNETLSTKANMLGREFVISITGKIISRSNKNAKIPTGEIEVEVDHLTILNPSKSPPFTIENDTDGGEEIRMKYRYLDLRRTPLQNNMRLRHKLTLSTRNFLDGHNFLDIETPYLIKSTPEGARDFVVPSRMNPGEFYALPQSPQTFKQLLMIGGYDRYFQIVRCFRDEDLRADRQPEFTQIDCEMAFVDREDILEIFEALIKHLFKELIDFDLPSFPRMKYDDAIKNYGSDKPDTRFGMTFQYLTDQAKGTEFKIFEDAQAIIGIVVRGYATYSRKELDQLVDFVKRPQVGAQGLIWVKFNADGSIKSSVDKFYTADTLRKWGALDNAQPGDLMLIMSGDIGHTQNALSILRLEMGNRLGLRNSGFSPLWVVDFPLLEWDEGQQRFHAMHHPFTAPLASDIEKLKTEPQNVYANAYDMVVNGVELGGGSIRIHDKETQSHIFKALGFTPQEADNQFGFLLKAFEYGAPPHGGIAFGLDRIAAVISGQESIRDFIAFPKNNSGRDVMIDAPAPIDINQSKELHLHRAGQPTK